MIVVQAKRGGGRRRAHAAQTGRLKGCEHLQRLELGALQLSAWLEVISQQRQQPTSFPFAVSAYAFMQLTFTVPVSTSSGLHHRLPAQLSRSTAAFRHISRVTPVVIVAVARESPGAATCSCRLQRVFSRRPRCRRVRGRR